MSENPQLAVDPAVNPAWPIAAVFDGLDTPNLNLAQDVTLAPNVSQDARGVLLLALIVAGVLLMMNRKR